MAHLLRGKQAGVQNDFSGAVSGDYFTPDDLRRYGIASRITKLAYDPIQSLLAAGTASTPAGPGLVYVFGHKRITATFPLATAKASVKWLQFCSDRLLILDDKNDFTIFSLLTKKIIASYSPPGLVMAVAADPTLDYAILGMHNGDILAYDMDRELIAPFRLPCFATELNPRARSVPIVSLELHPRDIGSLLIGYSEGAVIYSFKQNKPTQYFHYKLPRGAPGGDADPSSMQLDHRIPKLTHATWHPDGTYMITGHEDSSLVVWDVKEGRLLLARTLSDTHIDQPGAATASRDAGSFHPKQPITKIAWCCKQNPSDTGLLIAGGSAAFQPTTGLTFIELGLSPVYMTTPWPQQSEHFAAPKRQHLLPTPPNVEIVDFCLIPRKSPWFGGAQDPIAVMVLLSSGEMTTLSFPSGYPISPTNQIHLSLTFVHPFITCIAQASVERNRWLGLTESRDLGPKILVGGAEATHPLRRYEDRNIVITAHADGTVRLWDAGHGDEIENESVIQADAARGVGRTDNVTISQVSFSGPSGELAAGLQTGEIVIFRWMRNPYPGSEPPPPRPNKPAQLTDALDRRDPSLREGLLPFTVLDQQGGAVTALKVSAVGFVAAGFESGHLVLIDLRGPAIIFSSPLADFLKKEKSGPFSRRSAPSASTHAHATVLAFSVLTLDDADFSSINLHVGTSTGAILSFRIIPGAGGRYSADFAGASSLDDTVTHLFPLNAHTGLAADASQTAVASLRTGARVDGVLLAVARAEARIFKPAAAKGAHKSFSSGALLDTCAVSQVNDLGLALVALFGDGSARAFSLPGLQELASYPLAARHAVDPRRFPASLVTATGDVLAWTGPSELALLQAWGAGDPLSDSADRLLNPELLIPARPAISGLQWVTGTQYISPADLDLLVGGPNRPPSKRALAAANATEAQRREAQR